MSAPTRSRAPFAVAALLLLALVAGVVAWWSSRPRLELPDRAATQAGATTATTTSTAADAALAAELPAQRAIEAPTPSEATESPVPIAYWKPLLLHVVDASDGRELRGAAVHHRSEGSGPFARPDRDATLLAQGDSPLPLAPPAATAQLATLSVTVAGYETEPLRIDWSRGGERCVALQPAGSLAVEVVGAPAGAKLAVRLFERRRAIERLERVLRMVDGSGFVAGTLWSDRQRAALAWLRGFGGNATLLHRPEELLPQMSADLQQEVDAEGRARFEGLREGDWLIALHTAESGVRAWVGLGDARVDRDREARAVVPYAEPTERPAVALAGRVIVDHGWLAPRSPPLPTTFGLRSIQPAVIGAALGSDREIALFPDGEPGVLRFDAGEWRPGEVAATFQAWQFELAFEVPDFPDRDLELEIPPPADVTVQVRDLAGAPLARAWLRWRGIDDGRPPENPGFPVVQSDSAGRVAFRLPAGRLELDVACEASDLSLFRSHHVAAPGLNEIEVVARVAAAVDVTLLEGEAAIPWEWHHRVEASGPRGPIAQVGMAHTSDLGGPASRLLLDGEGPAQLIAIDVEGYLPSEPVAVELVRGGVASVEIVLRRRN